MNDLLENLIGMFHRVRPPGMDEELFDLVSSFEALQSSAAREHGSAKKS